jgi:hypothetical protein
MLAMVAKHESNETWARRALAAMLARLRALIEAGVRL